MEKDHEQEQRQFELGRAPQVQELPDDELQEVSGGYIFTYVMVESIVAPRLPLGAHRRFFLGRHPDRCVLTM